MHAGQAIVQFARSATEGCQKSFALKFFLKEKDFESEKSIYRNSPIGKLLPMLAGLVEDGQLSDPEGHALPPCIIMERGESLNEWCQRRKPDIWGVMPVRAAAPLSMSVPIHEPQPVLKPDFSARAIGNTAVASHAVVMHLG